MVAFNVRRFCKFANLNNVNLDAIRAKSMAKVKPTGPAPTTSTSLSNFKFINASVQFDVGLANDFGPFLGFAFDVGI